jgi:hypothetical protein
MWARKECRYFKYYISSGLAPGAKPELTLISGMVPGIIVKKIPIPPTFILIIFY